MPIPRRAAREVALFAVTPDRGDAIELEAKLPALAAGGVARVLLREPSLAAPARAALAERVARACAAARLELWISADAELALRVGAHGVHLPERSPPPSQLARAAPTLALGLSLHLPLSRPPDEIARCAHAFLAPLLPTPSKPGVEPVGLARFVATAAALPLPLYALGGLTLESAPALAAAGITRVAAIRLFFDAVDPERAARVLHERLAAAGAGEEAR
ncbi:MAG: thiamine phosphate synthase [Planctomycetes bacterium]|nr:thiamine phosphate synthase [Planctomycetota bacterium]